MGAEGLIEAKVKAVINAAPTMSGKYPINGPLLLLKAGIPVCEIAEEYFPFFVHGQEIVIEENFILHEGFRIPFKLFTKERWECLSELAGRNLGSRLSEFIDNTLHYARKEKDFVIHPLAVPLLRTAIHGRHVVVVVRGSGYKEDLQALKNYIEDYRPVLIGVDGGADALMEYGHTPDLIVGDMDSISDAALLCGSEILVHAYPDGRAPGIGRTEGLGLQAQCIPAPGTSEDIALLIAFEKNAELIVSLGTHTHMIDFLEKGRKGMASTMLVRMKIGSKLVDAKGVSKLYRRQVKWRSMWIVPLAGFFPLVTLALIHPGFRHLFSLMWMYVKFRILS